MAHDYSIYDARDKFRLWEVAVLWAEYPPEKIDTIIVSVSNDSGITAFSTSPVAGDLSKPRNAYTFFQSLKFEIEADDLVRVDDGPINVNTVVTRDALEKFARKMNQDRGWPLPKFLFPKERVHPVRRKRGESFPETIKKRKLYHEAVEEGLRVLGTDNRKEAAEWAAHGLDAKVESVLREDRRHRNEPKRQNGKSED